MESDNLMPVLNLNYEADAHHLVEYLNYLGSIGGRADSMLVLFLALFLGRQEKTEEHCSMCNCVMCKIVREVIQQVRFVVEKHLKKDGDTLDIPHSMTTAQ